MPTVERFAFKQVFTAERPFRGTETLALQIAELELEVERLKRGLAGENARGRTAGYEEALTQLQSERDTALLAAADALQASLESLDQQFASAEAQVMRVGAELALQAADFLAARALEREPTEAIEAAIGRALRQVRRGEPIEVRAHPELAAAVESMIADRQSRDRRRLFLTVIPDSNVPIGDARLEWEHGGLSLDRDARRAAAWGEMESMLASR